MKQNRIIPINGQINEYSSLMVVLQLLAMNSENDRDPIYLYINSGGGSIIHGLAIYDTIQHIKAPVYTVCCGMAASMGAFLLSCGLKGHRYALPHARILIHQPLIPGEYMPYDTQSGVERTAEGLNKMRVKLETIMAENTGKTLEQLHKDCERDNWMNSQDAIAYGLIDIEL